MNDKAAFRLVAVISVVVFVVVVFLQSKTLTLFEPGTEVPGWVLFLPTLNAMINGTCTVLLIISYYFIRKKQISKHKALNITTFILSSLFLVSYIIFHATGIRTTYGGEGAIRYFLLFHPAYPYRTGSGGAAPGIA